MMEPKTRHEQSRRLNIELLRQIQEAILEVPQQFAMDTWYQGDVVPGALDKCSSTACFAGWGIVLWERRRLSEIPHQEIESRARKILGITDDDAARRLFLVSFWPPELHAQFHPNPRGRAELESNARIAALRIEVYIRSAGEI